VWLARNFCQPVYEWFLYECVARGLIDAPGFLDDPVKRAAWWGLSGSAARRSCSTRQGRKRRGKWIDLGVETLESITTKTNGGDYRNQESAVASAPPRELQIKPAVPGQPAKPAADGNPAADSGGADK
jgi:hypothetical protein